MNVLIKNERFGFLKVDVIIMSLIIIMPFLFYLYNFAPKTKVWSTIWFKFDSRFFEDVNFFLWYIFVKLFTISILSIWFLSCKNLWRFILFVPITVEIFKLILILKARKYGLDYDLFFSNSFLISIPFCYALFIISKKIGYYEKANNYKTKVSEEINDEMRKLNGFNRQTYQSVQKDLIKLYEEKRVLDKKVYLNKLIALRDRLIL